MTARSRFKANPWMKFRLLMWKNFLLQWRHRIQTAVELLLPIFVISVVLLLRWQIEPSPMEETRYQPLPAYTLSYSGLVLLRMNFSNIAIAYSPASPVLEEVLRSAMSKLVLENLDYLPVTDNSELNLLKTKLSSGLNRDTSNEIIKEIMYDLIRVQAYNNSEEMSEIYLTEANIRSVLAAVEFDDELYGAEVLPTDLSYALRFPERPRAHTFLNFGSDTWRTDSVFPAYESPGPRYGMTYSDGYDPGYISETFIAVQHAISSALVSRVTGLDLESFNVYLQRYPHPAYLLDHAVDILQMVFPVLLLMSFSYSVVNIARAVTSEKELQLKEYMRIMGLPTWLHWTAWFCKQFIFQLIAAIAIVILTKIRWFTTTRGFSDYAVFTNTPWTLLFIFVLLYLSCMIFFSFMISSFFSKATTAIMVAGVLWFISYIPAILFSVNIELSMALQVICCFSINTAMAIGFQILISEENIGGIQWGSLFTARSESSRILFGHVVIMLVIDCILYFLITLYLEQVRPGPFGTPKPWNFPFQKQFWCTSNKIDDGVESTNHEHYDVVKDKEPEGHKVGVKIDSLTKVFGNNTAVDRLTMNIYDDQITVLLGHNGAGKSTTISMLTGNLGVTSGTITMAGYDLSTQTSAARAHIGLCAQHNVLFNDLTVKEHLQFFAKLKGFSGIELDSDIETLITKLDLQEKADSPSKDLSGGQKRRLCVGIALCGDAKVVLLDEPSSGLDPASRRSLWELLEKEKKGRSLILTTHFMDEADVLGDRVAIMGHGRLKCVGSPYFLKNYYGVGYTLVIVKDQDFDVMKCTSLINKYIPGTEVKKDRGTEVTYTLLGEYSHVFENMLSDLERNAADIKFKDYGLVATSLEDVFMSVGTDLASGNNNANGNANNIANGNANNIANGNANYNANGNANNIANGNANTGDSHKQEIDSCFELMNRDESSVKGNALIVQQVMGVWLKLGLIWLRSWWTILLLIFVPILFVTFTLVLMEVVNIVSSASIIRRLLMLTEGYRNTETLVSYNGTSTSSLGAVAASAYEMMFDSSTNQALMVTNIGEQSMNEYYLSRTEDSREMRNLRSRLIIGSTFSEESVTAWYSNFGYHDVAIALSAVHSALLKSVNPDASLSVSNYPLPATYEEGSNLDEILDLLSAQVPMSVGNSVAIMSAVFVMFYIKERVSGAKLLQKASGVQPVVLWASAAVFDWSLFMIACISIAVSCAAFQVPGLSTALDLSRFYLCVIIYGAAMLPLTYLLSLFFKKPSVGFACYYILNVIIGATGPQIVEILASPAFKTQWVANVLDAIFQFYPLYSFTTAVRNLSEIAAQKQTCLQLCNNYASDFECTLQNMCQFLPDECCVDSSTYLQWAKPGVLRYIIYSIVSCIVFWLILMVIEYRLYQKVYSHEKIPPPINESTLDDDVAAEDRQVQQESASNYSDKALLVNKLSKYYGKNLAVDQNSFRVNDGECFGLLGVNGAGKTTTFKMLMGDESISSGKAYISGHSVQTNLYDVYENIGYCPQFDALFNELTGRETLRIFAILRGLRRDLASDIAVSLAHSLGFMKHIDKRVHQYSGGTKRKLNTAVAFLGKTRLMFADEPTTGMDPGAKRHVWRAVGGLQRAGRGVVLTSHSMEECEALCSRLTIMVNGRFKCLGTPQHLKNKFSQGFTLTIKLKSEDNDRHRSLKRQASMMSVSILAVKDYVNANFHNPRIMEEYEGFLTYYVMDSNMAWSRMFGIMERAKRELGIEDYTISQTTLEHIFLQFTKYQGSTNAVNMSPIQTTVTHVNELSNRL